MKYDFNCTSPGSSKIFLQSDFWALFKSKHAWKASCYTVSIDGRKSYNISVLEKSLPLGLSFAYVPHGPVPIAYDELTGTLAIQEDTRAEKDLATTLRDLAKSIHEHLQKKCMFIRFDPPWYFIEQDSGLVQRPNFKSELIKGSDVQPPDTVVLQIDKSDEELLSGMKQKWRYNIRLAEKRGVIVKEAGQAGLEVFYSLYKETALRDKIAIHPKSYYAGLFELIHEYNKNPAPKLQLWIATYNNINLAAIICLIYGDTASYLYGASSNDYRNLMPSYALQWAAIKAAKDAGCVYYDFFGIPPTKDEDHPMSGLYRFKTGFGGQIRHYAGAWDYSYKPFLYGLFRFIEKARLYYYKVFKKNR